MKPSPSDMTPREQAILLLAQRKIRSLVRAQTGLTDADLDVLVDEIGDVAAMTRAANAIRRGDTSYAGPVAVPVAEQAEGQPQPAAAATAGSVVLLCVACEEPTDRWVEGRVMCTACSPPAVVEPEEPDDAQCDECETTGRNCAAHRTEVPREETAMPIRQEQLEDDVPDAATPPAVVDAIRVLDLTGQLTPSSDRATLTMPLARLVDIDGTETVLVQAVIDVQLLPSAVLDALDGRETEGPFTWTAERVLTAEGAEVVRTLAALLPQGGAE